MSDIEKRARELLLAEYGDDPMMQHKILEGTCRNEELVRAERALIAALTPPEGFVLVPVKITKEIEDVLHESFEYGYPAESTWDLAIHAYSPEVK